MFENEKTNNVEELGNKKLDLNIKYPEVDKGNNISILDGTIKKFIGDICGASYFTSYKRDVHIVEIAALNGNKDKIKQIVDYVVNCDENTLAYKKDGLIYNFHSHSG